MNRLRGIKALEIFVNPSNEIDLDAIYTDILKEQGQFSKISGWKRISLQYMRGALNTDSGNIVVAMNGEEVLGICAYGIDKVNRNLLSYWDGVPLLEGEKCMSLDYFGAKNTNASKAMIEELQSIAGRDGVVILLYAVDDISPFKSAGFIQTSVGPEYLYWAPPAIQRMLENGDYY